MKRSKKNTSFEKCVPLEFVRKMASYLPLGWSIFDEVRTPENKGKIWDEKCYISSKGICEAVLQKCDEMYWEEIIDNLQEHSMDKKLAIAVSWRIHKQIYEFDPDMERLLRSQADCDLKLPVDVLLNLPYPCIYFETQTMDMDGFFVFYEIYNDNLPRLDFLTVGGDFSYAISILLDPMETINGFYKVLDKRMRKQLHMSDEEITKSRQSTSEMLQLVLYVCAQNSEREEDQEQKKIMRQPKDRSCIKDNYREVQKWIYGEKTGNIIREMKRLANVRYIFNKENSGTGTPKRPHSRRGHWHYYWVGKRGTAGRKRVLRWLAPMFIHADFQSEMATINVVASEVA